MKAATSDELDSEIRVILEEKLAAASEAEPTVQEMRDGHDAETVKFSGPGAEVLEVRDLDAGGVPVRVYRPLEGPHEAGLVVYLHGGGWVVGSIDSYDTLCRALANASGARVASVGYRLAPEHPYPAALEDSLAAFDWLAENLPHTKLAVAGDSAGGTLAAIVARERAARLAAQLLVYPVCDAAAGSGSYAEFAEGFGLTGPAMRRFWDLYVGEADRGGPDACPAAAENLAGGPPAHVLLASHDVLRDEGRAYARRLEAAGVPVTLRSYPGTIHGFWRWLARSEVSRRAVAEAGAVLRAALA